MRVALKKICKKVYFYRPDWFIIPHFVASDKMFKNPNLLTWQWLRIYVQNPIFNLTHKNLKIVAWTWDRKILKKYASNGTSDAQKKSIYGLTVAHKIHTISPDSSSKIIVKKLTFYKAIFVGQTYLKIPHFLPDSGSH